MDLLAVPNKFSHGDEPFPLWSVPHAQRVQPFKTNSSSRLAGKGARIPLSTSGWVRKGSPRPVSPTQSIPAFVRRSNRSAGWQRWLGGSAILSASLMPCARTDFLDAVTI